ncbi:MAG: hypothetical protein R2695_06460 [Acidimicrobiales bacterium]
MRWPQATWRRCSDRPEEAHHEEDLERAPLARSVLFIVVGAIASIWALASLVAG